MPNNVRTHSFYIIVVFLFLLMKIFLTLNIIFYTFTTTPLPPLLTLQNYKFSKCLPPKTYTRVTPSI